MPTLREVMRDLTDAQRDLLLSGPDQFLRSTVAMSWAEFNGLQFAGLIEAIYPEAKPDDSGLQHWRRSKFGEVVMRELQLRQDVPWRGGLAPLSFAEGQRMGEAMYARWKANAGDPPFEEGDVAWFDMARAAFEKLRDLREIEGGRADAA